VDHNNGPYAVVISETNHNCMWFRHHHEQDLPVSYALIGDYSNGIERQLFQGSIRNSGFFFARFLIHSSENAKQAKNGIKEWETK
jgi:hypothetical protein